MIVRPNLRLVTDQIPLMQLEKKKRLAEIDRKKRTDADHAEEMLAGLMLAGVLATVCLLLAWYRP